MDDNEINKLIDANVELKMRLNQAKIENQTLRDIIRSLKTDLDKIAELIGKI